MKTNLSPMKLMCKLGFHSFTDKPYKRTYLECYHCKSMLPGYKRVWQESTKVEANGYTSGAYTLKKESETELG